MNICRKIKFSMFAFFSKEMFELKTYRLFSSTHGLTAYYYKKTKRTMTPIINMRSRVLKRRVLCDLHDSVFILFFLYSLKDDNLVFLGYEELP